MNDEELEQFCRRWVERKAGYVEVTRFAGSGDKGLDVVGFATSQRFEGAWDNYQCKQYRTTLGVSQGLLAVGKVLYYASRKEFALPRQFFFVAPKGLNQKLRGLINKPSEFKEALIERWDDVCADKIIGGKKLPIDTELKDAIEAFSFNNIFLVGIDELMTDPATVPLLVDLYGADPGQYPPAVIPTEVLEEEQVYLLALVEAYAEREGMAFASHSEVFAHPKHGPDIRDHRECYFEADAFQKFYRDSTSPQIIAAFRRDIWFGVKDAHKAPAKDSLARVEAVMERAAVISPAGPLAKYAYVPVKQGICHHFVNDKEMSWKAK